MKNMVALRDLHSSRLRPQVEQKRIRGVARSSTMKNLVALLCVISALLDSVFSYKCYSGISRNSTTCDESEIECLGDRCMTVSQYYYNHGSEFKSIMKGCANETMCGAKSSATLENVKYRFNVNCCIGNVCNSDGYELAQEDSTPNGVKCPSSYCTGSLKDCKTDKEINCTGSENRCYEFRADTIDPGGKETKFSVKGCMNSDGCKFSFDCAVGFSELKKTYVNSYTLHHHQGYSSD